RSNSFILDVSDDRDACLGTMTALTKMTVAQLKEALKARGLDVSGLKAALVARLEEAMAKDEDAAEEPAEEDAAEEEKEEATAEEKEDADEEYAPEDAGEDDVQAKADEMAEKAMAEHAASEKKRERSPEQDYAPPESQRARTENVGAGSDIVDGGLTRDGHNFAMYNLPNGEVRRDAPTQGNEGRIIGRGGSKIRELQDRFRVRITMNRPAGLAEVVGMLANTVTFARNWNAPVNPFRPARSAHTAVNRCAVARSVLVEAARGAVTTKEFRAKAKRVALSVAAEKIFNESSRKRCRGVWHSAAMRGGRPYDPRVHPHGAAARRRRIRHKDTASKRMVAVRTSNKATVNRPGGPLPHGWEEVNPGNGGPVYYWNTVTNVTQYERPTN
ncbi:hypothetical protein BE221DRAFT_83045, partial [Ostreococcus tauri]